MTCVLPGKSCSAASFSMRFCFQYGSWKSNSLRQCSLMSRRLRTVRLPCANGCTFNDKQNLYLIFEKICSLDSWLGVSLALDSSIRKLGQGILQTLEPVVPSVVVPAQANGVRIVRLCIAQKWARPLKNNVCYMFWNHILSLKFDKFITIFSNKLAKNMFINMISIYFTWQYKVWLLKQWC